MNLNSVMFAESEMQRGVCLIGESSIPNLLGLTVVGAFLLYGRPKGRLSHTGQLPRPSPQLAGTNPVHF